MIWLIEQYCLLQSMFWVGYLLWSTPMWYDLLNKAVYCSPCFGLGVSYSPPQYDMTNWAMLSIAVHVKGWGSLTVHPLFVGTSSCPGYHLVLVFLLFWWSSHSVQRGYKATFWPVARVPLHVGGSTLHQGGRHQLVHLPDMEGYLPITSPYLVLQNCDPVPWVVV